LLTTIDQRRKVNSLYHCQLAARQPDNRQLAGRDKFRPAVTFADAEQPKGFKSWAKSPT
jgi:hypothetical protein